MLTPNPQLFFSVKEWSALAATVMAARMTKDFADNIADCAIGQVLYQEGRSLVGRRRLFSNWLIYTNVLGLHRNKAEHVRSAQPFSAQWFID